MFHASAQHTGAFYTIFKDTQFKFETYVERYVAAIVPLISLGSI